MSMLLVSPRRRPHSSWASPVVLEHGTSTTPARSIRGPRLRPEGQSPPDLEEVKVREQG